MGHTERDMQRPTEYKKDWQKNMKGILLMLSHKILFKFKLLICSFSQTKGRQQHGFLQTPSCSCDVIFHMNVIMYEHEHCAGSTVLLYDVPLQVTGS